MIELGKFMAFFKYSCNTVERHQSCSGTFHLFCIPWRQSIGTSKFLLITKLMQEQVKWYIVTNTTIFLIVRLLLLRYNYMFRPSMLAIFRLYMKHLTISYIYMWVGSLQFVGWGGCEISFCVCRRGMGRVCLGGFVKISFMSTNSYVYPYPLYKHKTRSRTQPTPQTVNSPLTCRYSLSLSASCTTWRWPTLMAETCSCTLVILNVL